MFTFLISILSPSHLSFVDISFLNQCTYYNIYGGNFIEYGRRNLLLRGQGNRSPAMLGGRIHKAYMAESCEGKLLMNRRMKQRTCGAVVLVLNEGDQLCKRRRRAKVKSLAMRWFLFWIVSRSRFGFARFCAIYCIDDRTFKPFSFGSFQIPLAPADLHCAKTEKV